MAKSTITPRRTSSILSELEQLDARIRRRAYDLFRSRDSVWGHALEDWLTAERQLAWSPAVELREKDGTFEVRTALAGVEAEDLDVQVSPEDLLIKATTSHVHTADSGTVHLCEFDGGDAFRSVHFPREIQPDGVKADYRNGLLRVTAPIAGIEPRTTPKTVRVQTQRPVRSQRIRKRRR